jgi:hypothetical protein
VSRRDTSTIDMFAEWQPVDPVQRFDEKRVRAASLRQQMALGVAETLRDAEDDRDTIAGRMAEWLEEDVSKNLLDAYASQAREEHVISLLRLIALIHATGDLRILQLIAEMFGHSVIENRFLPLIEYAQLADKKEELERALGAVRRTIRRARP